LIESSFEMTSRRLNAGSGEESLSRQRLRTILPNEAPQGFPIAVVSSADTAALGSQIHALLKESDGFRCIQYRYEDIVGLRSHRCPEVFAVNVDLVVAALGRLQTDDLEAAFAVIDGAFQRRPIIAIPVEANATDIFRVLQAGAADFLLPPVRSSELLPRLLRHARAVREDPALRRLKEDIGLKQIIGESPAFVEKVRYIPRFARCDAPVLISGESGTGKEVFARAIHYLSTRAGRPFIPINCGALPENLVESEIFGHKRGAFTGATADREGLIREADDGTLFLDEIDCLTPQLQVKLLRFLQDGEYRSVGSNQILHANIRVIAATNADLNRIVQSGKFREDLFYRLNVLVLALPALRERPGDIFLLADDFLEKQAAITNTRPKNLSLAALNRLLGHSWPGNVRELQNVLMRAFVLCNGDTIEACDLGLRGEGSVPQDQSFRAMKSRAVWRFEHDFLATVLRANNGNITQAASAAKKNRRAFWELLRKHNLLTDVN
jgi:two-component system, NtrC family, response regulator GlrR